MTTLRAWAPPVARALLAVVAAVVTALVGYAVVALVVSATAVTAPEEQSGVLAWVALAGVLWAAPTHGVMLTVQGVDYSLLPWGLTLGIAALAYGSGSWWGRMSRVRTPVQVLTGIAIMAVTYAALVAGTLVLVRTPEWSASWPRVAAHAGVLMLIAGGIGVRRASQVSLHVRTHVPDWVMVTVRAAGVAVAALVACSALLLIGWIVARFSDVLQVQSAVGGGVIGGLVLLVITLAYLPAFLMWAMSYFLGAGFSLGSESLVSPFLAVTPSTEVPLIPIIASFPQFAAPLAWLYPCATVACGLLAGYLIARRASDEVSLMRVVIALLATTLTALVVAAGAWLASGSLGEMRLAFLGPLPEFTGSLAWIGVMVGMLPTALLVGRRRRPTLSVATPDILESVEDEAWTPR